METQPSSETATSTKSELVEPLGAEPCAGCHIPPTDCDGLDKCRPCDDNWNAGYIACLEAVKKVVESEPEYPGEAPPKLCAVLDQAIIDKDRDLLLHAMRETVRLTKQCIIERLPSP